MWFRRKKDTTAPQRQFFANINARIRACQRRVADRLNRRTAHWRRSHQIYFLLAVCGLLAAANLLPIGPFGSSTANLHQPAGTVMLPPSWRKKSDEGFSAKDSAAFLVLRHRLDSVLASESGRDYIRQVYQARPGFLDSVLEVERMVLPTLPAIIIPDSLKTTADAQP